VSSPWAVSPVTFLIVTGTNGAVIFIDPGGTYPIIHMYSIDGSNEAFFNITGGSSSADLGINSGVYTPADGTPRRGRLFFNGSIDLNQFAVIKASNQAVFGGFVNVRSTNAAIGYADADAGLLASMFIDTQFGGRIVLDPSVTGDGFVEVQNPSRFRTGGQDRGIGHRWSVGASVNSAAVGAGTEAIIENGIATTFKDTRAYLFKWRGGLSGGATASFNIRETNLAGAIVHQSHAISTGGSYDQEYILYNNTGADIVGLQLVLTLFAFGGAITCLGTALFKRSFACYDIGDAADYILEGSPL
jgi:hypothetical protein